MAVYYDYSYNYAVISLIPWSSIVFFHKVCETNSDWFWEHYRAG